MKDTDEGVNSDDDDSMDGGPDNEGEHINDDDGGNASGDEDTGGDDDGGGDTTDDGGGERANKRTPNSGPEQHNFSPASCQRAISKVFLTASRLRRVRLVVRTQPSQGGSMGSTPVRAATGV